MSEAQRLFLTAHDGNIPYTLINGGPGPGVVVVPSIFGIADDLIEQMGEVAAKGAWVAIIDPFWRTTPAGPMDYSDPGAALKRLASITVQHSYADFLALVALARQSGNGKVLGLGICFGGPFCFMSAASGQLDGVVTWHGSRLDTFSGAASAIACPVRLHFGEKDPVVPLYTVEAIREAFSAHADHQITVHKGAGHGFSHRTGSAHRPAAEQAGMASMHELVTRLS